MRLLCYDGPAVLAIGDELCAAYGDVFSRPPFNRDIDSVDHFRRRLVDDVHRPGFRAVVATSTNPAAVEGFATGWTTPAQFRTDRAYGKVLDQLGADQVHHLLTGALEVDELGVRPRARRRGFAQQLLTDLIADAPGQQAWLLTPSWAADTIAFYQHINWQHCTPSTGDSVEIFLSPEHPGRRHGLG